MFLHNLDKPSLVQVNELLQSQQLLPHCLCLYNSIAASPAALAVLLLLLLLPKHQTNSTTTDTIPQLFNQLMIYGCIIYKQSTLTLSCFFTILTNPVWLRWMICSKASSCCPIACVPLHLQLPPVQLRWLWRCCCCQSNTMAPLGIIPQLYKQPIIYECNKRRDSTPCHFFHNLDKPCLVQVNELLQSQQLLPHCLCGFTSAAAASPAALVVALLLLPKHQTNSTTTNAIPQLFNQLKNLWMHQIKGRVRSPCRVSSRS
jgi:hypothetical protein